MEVATRQYISTLLLMFSSSPPNHIGPYMCHVRVSNRERQCRLAQPFSMDCRKCGLNVEYSKGRNIVIFPSTQTSRALELVQSNPSSNIFSHAFSSGNSAFIGLAVSHDRRGSWWGLEDSHCDRNRDSLFHSRWNLFS